MHAATPALAHAALACALLALPASAVRAPAQDPGLPAGEDPVALIDRMVQASQAEWDADLPLLSAATAADPRVVIEALVARLDHSTQVPGLLGESQVYATGGNALSLLERLTDERICGLESSWIGFTTHDHRSPTIDTTSARGAWRAWLEVRADVPQAEWFWGLEYAELRSLSVLMRTLPEAWSEAQLAAARALGGRAYPYLLDKLVDNEYAASGRQFCTQANTLLQRLTGQDHGEILAIELLKLSVDDPERSEARVIWRNRASRTLVQQRWTAALTQR